MSPLVASVKIVKPHAPVWGESEKIYQKLPAFLADSLPDSWGNQLFDLWRQQNHLSPAEVTPLEKLSFIGKRGMGALEFEPELTKHSKIDKIDIEALTRLANRIFNRRESIVIKSDESLTMQALLAVGTSAGGRQAKAIIAVNRATGEIRSGQVPGLEGYDYCLLKFGNDHYCSAELEMTYYELATMAGITMMPSQLITIEGKRHFLTQRFDREGKRKLHTQTLAAIYPEAGSYEQLMWVCRKLRLPETDCEEVFRRMVFNHLANNTDDHHKNFSFVMNEKGEWRLSPAYDLTYIINTGGYQADTEHCMTVRAKLSDVTQEDALSFAKDNGIRHPKAIIRQVADALTHFRPMAKKHGVSERWAGRVEATLQEHLKSWGLIAANDSFLPSKYIEGHEVSALRIEQAYKGNLHLLATIEGNEVKYIIRKGTPEHENILAKGVINLTEEEMTQLTVKYLLPKMGG